MELTEEKQIYNSYAKINLSLEILHKRPDGFHELATVMQTIGLCDILTFAPAPDLQFDCNLEELVDEGNLVWKAALRLHELCPDSVKQGANIYLEKRIPVAAGLGGGSSNAATALVALNRLWNLNLSQAQLAEEAAQLGSDVPFFLVGGTALAEGRGERLTVLPALAPMWLVLLYPPLELPPTKTKELYRMLDRNDMTAGLVTRTLVRSINQGERPSNSLFFNGFEKVVYERFAKIDGFRQAMVEAGADHVWVSGSGPTLFTIVESADEGQQIFNNLQQGGYNAFLTSTIQP
ncbi:MAG: 4-(cytidine 5'-diphospho)-2-C-methyl-D-erythritol kinase [Chloroflexota bacterium]